MALSSDQVAYMLMDLNPLRVQKVDGLSHLEAFDVRATLNRVFGFGGWCEEAQSPPELMYEQETKTKKGDAAYRVAYRAHRRLIVNLGDGDFAWYDGSAVGESTMPTYKRGDCHDMAIKTAESQALKRCAMNLGTQFGLSLYRKGSTMDVVRVVLAPGQHTGSPVASPTRAVEPSETATGTRGTPSLAEAARGAADEAIQVLVDQGLLTPGSEIPQPELPKEE